eukprot:9659_1
MKIISKFMLKQTVCAVRHIFKHNNHETTLYRLCSRNIIDFSSDVRTVPTESMRLAMYNAKVGDDQLDEDPTVNLLQERMANLLKKEASLFIPSGIMGNLISIMTHCDERISEMIVGNLSHMHLSEAGSSSFIAGIHSKIIQNDIKGTLNLNEITNSIRWAYSYDPHSPKTKLLCLENTHNRCGGYILSNEYMKDVYNLLDKYCDGEYLGYKIPIHLDGARLFNAAETLNCEICELVQYVDSINICFSKGLGCPIGSILIGSNEFIKQAKRYRKALGGAMRQTGVIASCCLVALDEIVPLLGNDHKNAKYVYDEIVSMNINGLTLFEPETNILMFEIDDKKFVFNDKEYINYMKNEWEIRIHKWEKNVYRFVFHHQIEMKNIDILLNSFKSLNKQKLK